MEFAQVPQQIFRIDPLTGCKTLVSFCEWLTQHLRDVAPAPFSVIALDVNQFAQVNATKGHAYGDDVIRWFGFVLMEEIHAPVYRLGGDAFGVVLTQDSHAEHAAIARRAFDRLNRDAARFELAAPVATVTVVHYAGDAPINSADIWFHLYSTTYDAKATAERAFKIYHATELARADRFLNETLGRMIERIAWLGAMVDESQHLAFTDPVTGLPNQRAALNQIETRIAQRQTPFAVLMIDGDNLTDYNNISYAMGDEMIDLLGKTLHASLRPGDFLARWRVGDEFLIILPNVAREHANAISERFCAAVAHASQQWRFPVTISMGVAVYPDHGATSAELLARAEAGLKQAKDSGKNRAVIAS